MTVVEQRGWKIYRTSLYLGLLVPARCSIRVKYSDSLFLSDRLLQQRHKVLRVYLDRRWAGRSFCADMAGASIENAGKDVRVLATSVKTRYEQNICIKRSEPA